MSDEFPHCVAEDAVLNRLQSAFEAKASIALSAVELDILMAAISDYQNEIMLLHQSMETMVDRQGATLQ